MKKTCRIPYIAAGIICAFASGLLFTWSYWRAPLNELFPSWTTSDLSAIFSFHNTVVCVAMIVAGWLSKKLHVRVRMIIGAVLTVAGLGLYPLLPLDDPDAAYRMAFVLFSVVTPIFNPYCVFCVFYRPPIEPQDQLSAGKSPDIRQSFSQT